MRVVVPGDADTTPGAPDVQIGGQSSIVDWRCYAVGAHRASPHAADRTGRSPVARPCTVCAHRERGEIDRRLALQVCNVQSICRDFPPLHKDAVRNHRAHHLPDFLPAFQARAAALSLDALQAEAERLYQVTLDALAKAEAGVLVSVDPEGKSINRVSSTAVARLIREARAGLGLLASLAADGRHDATPAASANNALDERIALALARATDRANERLAIGAIDAVVVEPIAEAGLYVEPMLEGANERTTEGSNGHIHTRINEHKARQGNESMGIGEGGIPKAVTATPSVSPPRGLVRADGGGGEREETPSDSESCLEIAEAEICDDVPEWIRREQRRAELLAEASRQHLSLSPAITIEELDAMHLDPAVRP